MMISISRRQSKSRGARCALKILLGLVTVAFWVFLWWIVARRVNAEVILPTPRRVAERFIELAQTRKFWLTSLHSLGRILSGYLCGVVGGIVLALITHFLPPARTLFSPLLTVIRSTPVASFVILALIFIGNATLPLFISSIIVLPVIWGNIVSGLDSIDKGLLEVSELYALGFRKRWHALYFPSLRPYLFPALTSSLGLAWKSGISAEVIANTKNSIGNMLHESQVYLETTDLFVWTLAVIILSLILEATLRKLNERSAKK